MELFPAIDVRGGRCVRLRQGDYADETVYGEDPAAVAMQFVAQGASWVHTVDLDAARTGEPVNRPAIAALCEAVRTASRGNVRVQCGGGVRSIAAAEALFALGVARVVVGTAAVEDPHLVPALASRHRDGVAVGLDVRAHPDGYEVAVRGWTAGSGLELVDVADRFADAGAAAIVATEIGRDGMLTGPDLALYRLLLARSPLDIVASGGVGSLEDLRALATLREGEPARSLRGAIVGKAIYERRFTVADGVAACRATLAGN